LARCRRQPNAMWTLRLLALCLGSTAWRSRTTALKEWRPTILPP